MPHFELPPCLRCQLRPIGIVGQLFGLTNLTGKCTTKENSSTFRSIWYLTLTMIFTIILLITAATFKIIDIIDVIHLNKTKLSLITTITESSTAITSIKKATEIRQMNIIHMVIISIELLNIIISIIVILLRVIQTNLRTRTMNDVSKLLFRLCNKNNRSINYNTECRIILLAKRYSILIIFIIIFQIIFVYFASSFYYKTIDFKICWKILLYEYASCICIIVFLISAVETVIYCTIFRELLQNIYYRLENILHNDEMIVRESTSRSTVSLQQYDNGILLKSNWLWSVNLATTNNTKHNNNNNNNDYKSNNNNTNYNNNNSSIDSNAIDFCDKITNIRTMYGNIIKTIRKINNGINPFLIIALTLVMIQSVMDIYLITQLIIIKIINYQFILSLIRLLLNFISFLFMINSADHLHFMGNKFISLILQTKTAPLFHTAVTQLELTLRHIYNNPPLLTASDVFNFNTSILFQVIY